MLAAPVAALDALPAAGPSSTAELQEALLSVSVNGAPGSEPRMLLKGADGSFYAAAADLADWRLIAPAPAFTRDGTRYYLLNTISGLTIDYSESSQSLTLTARADTFGLTRLAYAQIDLGEELAGGTGGFLNYDVSGQLAAGNTSLGGAFEAGVFTRFGVGVTSLVGQWAQGAAKLVRLDSSWTIDDPGRMRSVRLGDGISRGGVGGTPLRFGGIQFARNFGVQPGFVTIPLPALRGSAALPSVVDIYVNDVLTGSRDVQPGPFEIAEIPIVSGNGDVQLVVRDMLGREMLYTQSYYAAPALLRRGLHDFSYEAGFLRSSFGVVSNDYGRAIVSATHRYGFSDGFTGEVHAEASRDIQLAGAAASFTVPGVDLAEASLGGSRSYLGTGTLAGFSLERRSPSLSLGIRAQVTSPHYMSLGLIDGRRPAASTVQAFAGLPTAFGSLGFTYLRRKGRGEPDAEYVSGNSSFRLGRLGSLHLSGRKSLAGRKDLAAELFLVIRTGRQSSTTTGVALDKGGLTYRTAAQRGLPVGNGFGYRFAASSGAVDRLEGKLSLQSAFGTHEAEFSRSDGQTGLRLSTAGGIGTIGGKLFASRPLSESFATVKVGDFANVRVYADNQLVGRTGRDGTLVVPRLRAFDRNELRIEPADLPWDAHFDSDRRIVRPYLRHGVAIDFAAKPARAAIATFLLDDGSPLPAGAIIRLNGAATEFVSAPGGEVYLTDLETENTAVASWSAGSCAIQFSFAPTADPQPRLGSIRCRSAR